MAAAGGRFLVLLGGGVMVVMVVAATLLIGQKETTLSRGARANSYFHLVGGSRAWEGQLIWTSSNTPVCRQGMTQEDTDVICRSLFPDRPIGKGRQHDAAQLPPGGTIQSGDVSFVELGCTGLENNVNECSRLSEHSVPRTSCPRGSLALSCEVPSPEVDKVRLVGGSSTEGRVELLVDGNWSTVCNPAQDTQLSRQEAEPICKSLGFWYVLGSASTAGSFGESSENITTSVPQCTGSEPDVGYCTFQPITSGSLCNHTEDAAVTCTIPSMLPTSVQLKGYLHEPWKGAVSILEPHSASTTGVCGQAWNAANTNIACKTAGFLHGGEQLTPMTSAGHVSRVRIERLECKGQEATLAECPGYDLINSFQCGPDYTIAAVDCSGNYTARLVGGNAGKTEGAVEIYLPSSNQWVAVNNGSLSLNAAMTVCSTIRYPDTHPKIFWSYSGSNTTVASVDCDARQLHISQCTLPTPSDTSVPHAAVKCFGCGNLYTSEKGDVTVMTQTSKNTDCMYVIRPQSPATLYKLWFEGVTLFSGDLIDVRERPEQDPVGFSQGRSNQGPFVLFSSEVYVRVKTSNASGHQATLHWAPVTVETVTSLTCTDDDMKVRVNVTELRWLYNDTDPGYISLVNEGCTGTAIGDTWLIDNPHSQCYTQRTIDNEYVHYRNALIYKERGAGPIVREHRWRVDLNCNFRRQMQVDVDYAVKDRKNYELNLNSDYTATIHMYNDSSLKTELQTNQIRARLGDDLFVKIQLSGDWNVSMHLQSCVARPEPQSSTSYTLIQNGCPADSETFIVFTTKNSTLFHFKAFEFYSGFSTVYIDCDVTYCAPSDFSARCHTVCR